MLLINHSPRGSSIPGTSFFSFNESVLFPRPGNWSIQSHLISKYTYNKPNHPLVTPTLFRPKDVQRLKMFNAIVDWSAERDFNANCSNNPFYIASWSELQNSTPGFKSFYYFH